MSCCSGCASGAGCADPRSMIGDIVPRVVYPSDVDREKARLHPSFVATNLAVASCQLDAGTRGGWDAFFADWTEFHKRETPLFGSANEWDLSQQYARDLDGWRSVLHDKCELAGPDVKPTDTGDVSWIKWVAGAVAVIGIAYTAGPFLRSLRR